MNAKNVSPAPFAILGVVTALLLSVTVITAMFADAAWIAGESKMYLLGSSSVDISASLYIYGIFIASVLALVFGIGKAITNAGLGRACGVFVLLAAIAGIAYASMIMDGASTDYIGVRIVLATLIVIAMALSAYADWSKEAKIRAAFTAILLVILLGTAACQGIAAAQLVLFADVVLWLAVQSAVAGVLDN